MKINSLSLILTPDRIAFRVIIVHIICEYWFYVCKSKENKPVKQVFALFFTVKVSDSLRNKAFALQFSYEDVHFYNVTFARLLA